MAAVSVKRSIRKGNFHFLLSKTETTELSMTRENVRMLSAGPLQFAPRKFCFWPITRYCKQYLRRPWSLMIDVNLNTCCKLKPVLYFWKSVFKIILHTFPCFNSRLDSILKWAGFISNRKFPDCVHFFLFSCKNKKITHSYNKGFALILVLKARCDVLFIGA